MTPRKLRRILRLIRRISYYLLIPVILAVVIGFYVISLKHTGYEGEVVSETAATSDESVSDTTGGKEKDKEESITHIVLTDLTQGTPLEQVVSNTGAAETAEEPVDMLSPQQSEPFLLTILDVGQASAAVIESNGEYMIFDGGDRKTSSFVVAWCKQHGIKRFKYMVASHYHADHIYGLIGILESGIAVDNILVPDYVSETYAQKDFLSRVDEEKITYPYPGQKFSVGDITARCICPVTDAYSDDNGYSIGMIFEYKGMKVLLDGDATAESEADMLSESLDLEADILIVPHHGSMYSSTSEWLEAVSPSVAIISCGKDNDYYHPHEQTLKRLSECGIKEDMLFRTDLQGTVSIRYTDESISIETEKEASIKDLWISGGGEEKDVSEMWDTDTAQEDYYIGNSMTKKFHRPNCQYLPAEDRRVLFSDRQAALTEHYTPCGECRP